MTRFILTVLALITVFFAQAQQQSLHSISDSIEAILQDKHIPGAFITIVSKDSVLLQDGFGYVDVTSKTKTTPNDLFKIGSVSKTFTALAIMKLVEEGKLHLDDKLADIAPEIPFKNSWEATHPVRLKHLLEHKAGFDDMPISVIVTDRTEGMSALDEILRNKAALTSRWQPGLGHAYSNPGYMLLGYIIEKISNTPYQNYIKNKILLPLQMQNTSFRSRLPATLASDGFAIGYSYSNDTITKSRDSKIIGEAAGALLSNAADMRYFLQFMLNQQLQDSLNVVSPASIAEMERLHGDLELENNMNQGYSLGLYNRFFGTGDIPFIGHSGGINGFASDFIYSKELDLGIAISNNGERGNGRLLDFLVDSFVEKAIEEKVQSNLDLTQFLDWEGEYRMLTTRNQIFDFIQFPLESVKIEVTQDSLFLTRFLQDKDAFTHQEGIAFIQSDRQNPSLFLMTKGGEKLLTYNKDILVPVNSFGFLLLRILLALSLVTGLVSILSLIITAIIALFNARTRIYLVRNFTVALPFILLFSSILSFFLNASSLDKLVALGQVNFVTLVIFLSTTLFPIAAVWAGYWLYKHKMDRTKRFLKFFYGLTVFCSIFLAVYCINHGWFLKMMWN